MQNPLQPDNGGVSDGDEREEDYALFWHKDPDYTWNDGDFRKDRVTVCFYLKIFTPPAEQGIYF